MLHVLCVYWIPWAEMTNNRWLSSNRCCHMNLARHVEVYNRRKAMIYRHIEPCLYPAKSSRRSHCVIWWCTFLLLSFSVCIETPEYVIRKDTGTYVWRWFVPAVRRTDFPVDYKFSETPLDNQSGVTNQGLTIVYDETSRLRPKKFSDPYLHVSSISHVLNGIALMY